MRKIRRVYMTLALAVLLAGMTACGNNTTNDTGNGNTNTESDMGQTDNRNDVHTTEMPSNDNVNDETEGTDGNANGTNGTNTGDRNTLGDDVGDAAEYVTRGVGEGVEDVGRAVDDVVSGGDNETQNPQENGATTQNGAGMAQ